MGYTAPRTWVTGELVTAALMNTHVRDNLVAIYDTNNTTTGHDHDGVDSKLLDWDSCWADAVHSHASAAEGGALYSVGGFVWTIGGTLTVSAGQGFRLRSNGTLTFTEAELLVKTAPTDAALIVDINKNGVSLFTAGNRPQIASTATEGESTTFDVSTCVDDDVLTIDIDAIGSSVAGADLTVILWYKRLVV